MPIPIKLKFMSKDIVINAEIELTDQIYSVLPLLEQYRHESESLVFIFQGRRMDQFATFEAYGVCEHDVIQIIINKIAPQANAPAPLNETFRGGYEQMLQTGVERPEVLRARLSFLARTGYLTQEQLQILYLNGQILPPPRGYTAPRIQQVKSIFEQILCESLNSNPPFDVKPLYVPYGRPQAGENYPAEFLSQTSFVLMMLEGGFLPQDQREMESLASFSFLTPDTPCPVIPMRAMKLEIEWQNDQQNHYNLQQLARDLSLEGPGNPVYQTNRVMSSFQKLLTMVAGILLGLVFNVVVLVFSLHDSMPGELRLGIMIGSCANVVFALFIGLAGL